MKKMIKTGFAFTLALAFAAGLSLSTTPAQASACPVCTVPPGAIWAGAGCCHEGDRYYILQRNPHTGQVCKAGFLWL